jgi:hypothetical protein
MSDEARTDGEPLTRTEAIRRAMEALGDDAKVPEILSYVWEHFGIGVPQTAAESPSAEAPQKPSAQKGKRTE